MTKTVKKKLYAIAALIAAVVLATVGASFAGFAVKTASAAETTPRIYFGIFDYEEHYPSGDPYTAYRLVLGNAEADITAAGTPVLSGAMDNNFSGNANTYKIPWLGKEDAANNTHVPGDYFGLIEQVDIVSEIAPKDMGSWFYHMRFETIDLSNVDMSGTDSMAGLFEGCSELKSFSFTGLRVPQVGENYRLDISNIFSSCFSLESVDLSALTVTNGDNICANGNVNTIVAPAIVPLWGNYQSVTINFSKMYRVGTECKNKIEHTDAGKTFTLHTCTNFTYKDVCAATCTQTGVIKAHWACTECGTAYKDENGNELCYETVISEKAPHTYVNEPKLEPTCTEEGRWPCQKCSVCGHLNNVQSIPALGHRYGDWIAEVAATATENGVKGHYTCSRCSKHFDADHVEIADLTIAATGAPSTPSEPTTPGDPTTPGEPTASGDTSGGNDLPTGAIVGISVGSVVGVLILLYVIGLVLYKKDVIDWGVCKKIYFFIKK